LSAELLKEESGGSGVEVAGERRRTGTGKDAGKENSEIPESCFEPFFGLTWLKQHFSLNKRNGKSWRQLRCRGEGCGGRYWEGGGAVKPLEPSVFL